MKKSDKIFITGSDGLLGSAILNELQKSGYTNLLTASRSALDLTDESRTQRFIADAKPAAIIHCAALVGGIQANLARPAEFLFQNLSMQNNVIDGAHHADVQTLIAFGSNCMYPTDAEQPMAEEQLLQGPIEPSNLAYGAAKIAGLVQCQSYSKQYGRNYMTVIPASLYGPHDNYDPKSCHVTPGLLVRMHEAIKVGETQFSVWGTGKPRRELLHSSDAARGVRMILEQWDAKKGPVNLGAGDDFTVAEIAESLKKATGYEGNLVFDSTKPDGSMRKLLDSRRINALGFKPSVTLLEGLASTYNWFTKSDRVRR